MTETMLQIGDFTIQTRKLSEMLDGLREMQQAMTLDSLPVIKGLDIQKKCIRLSTLGGDYFDLFHPVEDNHQCLRVVMGDACGHDIVSAFLVTDARGMIRMRSSLPGTISQIISDVNRQFIADVNATGHFMTLVYLELDLVTSRLQWVNAGQDPPIVYDPKNDHFETLDGNSGPAIGVAEDTYYTHFSRMLADGQIVVMATDGIWEARNPRGRMYGKRRIRQIIRKIADADADTILHAILADQETFAEGESAHDDRTLVVMKR